MKKLFSQYVHINNGGLEISLHDDFDGETSTLILRTSVSNMTTCATTDVFVDKKSIELLIKNLQEALPLIQKTSSLTFDD